MTVRELKERLSAKFIKDDDRVTVRLAPSGWHLSANATVSVDYCSQGIDWEKGQLVLTCNEPIERFNANKCAKCGIPGDGRVTTHMQQEDFNGHYNFIVKFDGKQVFKMPYKSEWGEDHLLHLVVDEERIPQKHKKTRGATVR